MMQTYKKGAQSREKRIERTYQTPEMSTGDYAIVDEDGRVWVRDDMPQTETTGVQKAVRRGDKIYLR